jgi:hypothetical protein
VSTLGTLGEYCGYCGAGLGNRCPLSTRHRRPVQVDDQVGQSTCFTQSTRSIPFTPSTPKYRQYPQHPVALAERPVPAVPRKSHTYPQQP